MSPAIILVAGLRRVGGGGTECGCGLTVCTTVTTSAWLFAQQSHSMAICTTVTWHGYLHDSHMAWLFARQSHSMAMIVQFI